MATNISVNELASAPGVGREIAGSIVRIFQTYEQLAGFTKFGVALAIQVPKTNAKKMDQIQAAIDFAKKQIPFVQVDVSVQDEPVQRRSGGLFGRRMSQMASRAQVFSFDPNQVRKLAAMLEVMGPEVGRMIKFVRMAIDGEFAQLNGRSAISRLQDDWLLRVAASYRDHQPVSGTFQVTANPQFDFHADTTVVIVPPDARKKYWTEVSDILVQSGFFEWLEQMAKAARLASKRDMASLFGNVTNSLAELRLDPDSMKVLHERTLRAFTTFMEDRTLLLTAERIAGEYKIVSGLVMDPDFIGEMYRAPRGQDVVQYFLEGDHPEFRGPRMGMMYGQKLFAMVDVMAEYDPNVPYANQMPQWFEAANELYQAMEEMARNAPTLFGYRASNEQGAVGMIKTLVTSVTVSVSTPSGTTQVDVSVKVGGRKSISVIDSQGDLRVIPYYVDMVTFRRIAGPWMSEYFNQHPDSFPYFDEKVFNHINGGESWRQVGAALQNHVNGEIVWFSELVSALRKLEDVGSLRAFARNQGIDMDNVTIGSTFYTTVHNLVAHVLKRGNYTNLVQAAKNAGLL